MGSKKQKEIIKKYLGKRDLTPGELEKFKNAVIESGALQYCQDLSDTFVRQSLAVLAHIDFKNEEAKEFLTGLAEHMVKREI